MRSKDCTTRTEASLSWCVAAAHGINRSVIRLGKAPVTKPGAAD
jgi:hypothetical protein